MFTISTLKWVFSLEDVLICGPLFWRSVGILVIGPLMDLVFITYPLCLELCLAIFIMEQQGT